jgi:hypothetical protein
MSWYGNPKNLTSSYSDLQDLVIFEGPFASKDSFNDSGATLYGVKLFSMALPKEKQKISAQGSTGIHHPTRRWGQYCHRGLGPRAHRAANTHTRMHQI